MPPEPYKDSPFTIGTDGQRGGGGGGGSSLWNSLFGSGGVGVAAGGDNLAGLDVESMAAELQAAMAQFGGSGGQKYIGVDDDYTATRRTNIPAGMMPWKGLKSVTRDVKPLYKVGDELLPGNLSADKISDIQKELVDIGLLKGGYRKSVWDQPTIEAYANLLAYANQQGLTREQAMARFKSGETIEEPPDPYGPLVYQEPSRLDVDASMREAFTTMTGMGPNPEAITAATDAYIATIRATQKAEYDINKANYEAATAGETEFKPQTITEAPSMDAFAMDYVRRTDPEGVQRETGLNLIQGIFDNLNGWGS